MGLKGVVLHLVLIVLLGFVGRLGMAAEQSDVTVNTLRCEYRLDPIGIDVLNPRLSWQLASPARARRQSAYRILVATSVELLAQGQGDLWDSGKVVSDQSLHVRYVGKPLRARQGCFWQVRIWDQDGRPSDFSDVASWEIGLPKPEDWQGAQWIRWAEDKRKSALTERTVKTRFMAKPRQAQAHVSPLMRREFSIRAGVQRARLYICGLGYFEATINGRRCGDVVLEPGQTSYDKRAFYVTHDVGSMLRDGVNVIGVILGNGFFGQNHGFNAPGLGYAPPALIAKLVVDYADGSTEVIPTDLRWKADTGPILYDNVYGGESYDARLEQTGWDEPGFDDSVWSTVQTIAAPTKELQAQMVPPIRRIQTLTPQTVWAGGGGVWIFDLGQNIAGWAKIKLQAPAGTQLTLKFAEIVTADKQHVDYITTGAHATGLKQTDIYVCKGGGLETWEPRFTYHGFRYVEVLGLPEKPKPDFLEGVLVRSDVPKRGFFDCSDPLVNRIYRTSLWTLEDNLHSILEDCPHREKCAWLGDTHAVGETAIFNYDMAQFFTKFVDDIETVLGRGGVTYWKQKATPGIPCNIAVGKRLCQEARPDWGSAYVMVPWYLYQYYGDTDVFNRHYQHLQRWIDYVSGLREEGIVVRGYGDWCPPGTNESMECPVPLTSTAFYYATLRMMAGFARHLHKTADLATYTQLAEETKAAFNRKFYDQASGGYGSQTADAVVLRFGLAPEGKDKLVAQSMRRGVVDQHKGHAFVGIHGARPLYTQLCQYGFSDVALNAMTKKSWPSYAYTLNQGLTTWPEILDEFPRGGSTSGRSLNHPMQSGFAACFHESIGGIQPAASGFKEIVLKPHGYHELSWVRAEHESPYGTIKSQWSSKRKRFLWRVTIPPNTTATVYVPVRPDGFVGEGRNASGRGVGLKLLRREDDRAVYRVESGSYSFESAL